MCATFHCIMLATNTNHELPHITFESGLGWNIDIDGSWKDRSRDPNYYPTNKELKWGEQYGFKRPIR